MMQNKGQVDVLHGTRESALARAREVALASRSRVFVFENERLAEDVLSCLSRDAGRDSRARVATKFVGALPLGLTRGAAGTYIEWTERDPAGGRKSCSGSWGAFFCRR